MTVHLSVCMSTYNRDERMLHEVFASVCKQKPSFEYEVIVVDDGSSSDVTEKICSKYPIRYIRI